MAKNFHYATNAKKSDFNKRLDYPRLPVV